MVGTRQSAACPRAKATRLELEAQGFAARPGPRPRPNAGVPAAVALGVPMYSNAAGVIPVVEALLEKGAAIGTVLAFMMSVTALSLPEMIILRKVLSIRLIAVFAGTVAAGILAVGYLFNILFL